MFYSGSRSKLGKPTATDGSAAGQNYPDFSIQYAPTYEQTVTTSSGAISQINDLSGNGNNATQGTAANRPLLTGASNLENRALQSEDFTSASWTNVNSTDSANATTAPDGTLTADKLIEDATTAKHSISQLITFGMSANVQYRVSVYAKAAERSWIYITEGNNVTATCFYDLANGVLGTTSGTGSPVASIESVGDGWYRCTLLLTPIAAAANVQVAVTTGNNVVTHTGDITKGVYLWGAQLSLATASTTYTSTTTLPVLAGLQGNRGMVFDGTNDSLATSLAVNPTGGMYGFAVVRANNITGNQRIMAGFVADATARFALSNNAGVVTLFIFNGSTVYIGRTSAASALIANETAVISFTYDGGTSASGLKIYKNGTQIDTTDSNAGVFTVPTGSAVLRIGADGDASRYLNGTIYETIFTQGSTITDANRQLIEQRLIQQYIPNYVWFSPQSNVTTDTGAVASWTDTTNTYVASQSTAASRPYLSGSSTQENRVIYSNDISQAVWAVSNSTKSGSNAFYETVTVGSHRIQQENVAYIGGSFIIEAEFKSIGGRDGALGTNNGTNFINLTTGATSGSGATSQDMGGGWWKLTTGTLTQATNARVFIYSCIGTTLSYAGDITKGVEVRNIKVKLVGTDFLTTNTTTYPIYAGINGQQALVFDGSNDSLATGLAVNPTGGMAGVVVVRANTIAADGAILGARNASANDRLQFMILANGGIVARSYNGSTNIIGRTAPVTTVSANELCVISFTYDGGTLESGIKIYKNGTQVDTANSSSGAYTVPTAGNVLTIGVQNSGNFLNGYIADAIFVQGRQMSEAEMQNYVTRFREKWGI